MDLLGTVRENVAVEGLFTGKYRVTQAGQAKARQVTRKVPPLTVPLVGS